MTSETKFIENLTFKQLQEQQDNKRKQEIKSFLIESNQRGRCSNLAFHNIKNKKCIWCNKTIEVLKNEFRQSEKVKKN